MSIKSSPSGNGEAYVIGVDSGTESCRAIIVNAEGKLVAESVVEYSTFYPKPGWAEQDPNDIWRAVCESIKRVVKTSGVNPSKIVGIGVDGTTSTVIACDEHGKPLRKAILWSDVRAALQADRLTKTGHKLLKYYCGSISAESIIAKALWLKENEPEIWNRAKYVVESTDWIIYKLTGRWTVSRCCAAVRGGYITELGGWPEDFFQQAGLEDMAEKRPAEVLPMGALVGKIKPDLAKELGLDPETVVAEGGTDAMAGCLGLGAIEEGRLAVVLGSSTVIQTNSKKPVFSEGIFITAPDAIVDNYWLHVTGEASTGSVIKWFREQFGKVEEEIAKRTGKRVYELLDEKAGKIPPGSEGIVVLQHWQGSRIYGDPLSRGIILGLTLASTKEHIYRAIVESTAYSTNLSIELLRKGGIEVKSAWACGGFTKSKFAMQLYADICGLRFYLPEVTQAVALGSAITATVAAGIYKDLHEAAQQMVRSKAVIEPNEKMHEKYQFYYEIYKELYHATKELLHKISLHQLETR